MVPALLSLKSVTAGYAEQSTVLFGLATLCVVWALVRALKRPAGR